MFRVIPDIQRTPPPQQPDWNTVGWSHIQGTNLNDFLARWNLRVPANLPFVSVMSREQKIRALAILSDPELDRLDAEMKMQKLFELK